MSDRTETERFLMKTSDGGSIVSTNGLTQGQIANAAADNRMLVLENGLGFVYMPAWALALAPEVKP